MKCKVNGCPKDAKYECQYDAWIVICGYPYCEDHWCPIHDSPKKNPDGQIPIQPEFDFVQKS